jgi:hypothetical protein
MLIAGLGGRRTSRIVRSLMGIALMTLKDLMLNKSLGVV